MSILIIGATGTIGSLVTAGLVEAGAEVHALVRQAGKREFPAGVTEVVADLTDVPSMRAALAPVRTLFLLNAVTPDEVTQALITLNLAREAGIERIVYLSVIHADRFTNVPHFTGKWAVERMIESLDLPATILRPAYFMQNDLMVRQTIENYALYPMPIGSAGVAMIDARDIADVAVAELLRRDQVWFMEKDDRRGTRLYPLSDFSARENEAIERGYLNGRYGGIPFLKELDFYGLG